MPAWIRAARLVCIDLEDPVELTQIKADGAGKSVADDGLDAADDRGAAPERDDRDLGPAAQSSTALDIRFIRGQRDEVWCVGEVAVKGSNRLRIRTSRKCAGAAHRDRS